MEEEEEEYKELSRENDRIEILEHLQNQFPLYVNPEFISLKIYQTETCVYLEKVYRSRPNEIISEPLNFISGFFDPQTTLEQNAIDLVYELGDFTIAMTFEDLFPEVALEVIEKAHSEEK